MSDAATAGTFLAARLADVEATIDRYGSFAFRPDDKAPPPTRADGDAIEAALDLVLRALRVLSDPLNHRMLVRLVEGDTPLDELSSLTGLPRLAVWERVNDLVQVGLAGRDLERDQAGLTGAGQALTSMVDEIAQAAAAATTPATTAVPGGPAMVGDRVER